MLGGCIVRQDKSINHQPEGAGTVAQPKTESGASSKTTDVKSVEVIDLSEQNLTQFPKEILNKTNAKVLILSNNNLKTLPAEIGELHNLEEMYLDNNKLDGALPAEIRKMPQLRILDAHNNNMTGIPA